MDISLARVDLSSSSHSFLPHLISVHPVSCSLLRCVAVSRMLRSSPLSCRHTCLSERQVGCGLGGSVCSDTPVLKLAVSIQGVGGGCLKGGY